MLEPSGHGDGSGVIGFTTPERCLLRFRRAGLEAVDLSPYDCRRDPTRAARLGGVHEAPTDRRLPVREGSLRDHRRAAVGLYLPLPGLPTPDQQRVLLGDR